MLATFSVDETFLNLRKALSGHGPDAEIYLMAELAVEIQKLKREKNAVILGHNYMEPALFHSVCDYKGDSLELARISAQTQADTIVFCGVEFMAETAKILNPTKKVLIPSNKAGCSLAESITAKDVEALREAYPGVPIVTYINTYAEVKAACDICCTSGNASALIRALPHKTVIMLPDRYLAANVARETGRHIIIPVKGEPLSEGLPANVEQVMIGWDGKCIVHDRFTVEDIQQARAQFPGVTILAHPECPEGVVTASDFSGSTSAMIKYVKDSEKKQFLLLTECSMADNIMAENKEKDLLRMCSVRCPYMAQISLSMTRDALLYDRYEVSVDPVIAAKAKASIDRMFAMMTQTH